MSVAAPVWFEAPPNGFYIPPAEGPNAADYHGPPLLHIRMSYQQFLDLPEKPKAEWVDGEAVIHMNAPQSPHGVLQIKLGVVLFAALPGLTILGESWLHLAGDDFRPDVMAAKPPVPKRVESAPIIIVEVLSPGTRRWDLIRKADAYLKAGVKQYWTVDTDAEEITVRENAGDHWEVIATVDGAHTKATVKVGEYGRVALDRQWLFLN